MRFAAGNAQDIGARPQQQDAFGFSDPSDRAFVAHGGFLGMVADGVGGLTHGSEASQSAVRAFLQAYHLKSPQEKIPAALARALREANGAVLRVNSEAGAEGAGTTLAAAVLHDHSLYWISAGDSRIYLLHSGRLTRITQDHTYARQLDEQAAQGKISRAEAQNNAERGSLTSYLGQPEPKELDRNTRPLALQPHDTVVLCSDGFYRALNEPEIAGAFHDDLQKACETLVRQAVAKQRKGQDNLTVIALQERGRSRKLRGQERGGKGSRVPVYASAFVVLALLSAGAAYWYRTPTPSAPVVQHSQPNPGPSASQGQDTSSKEIKSTPPENPPPEELKQQAATTPTKTTPRRPPKSKPKAKPGVAKTAPAPAAPKSGAGGTPQSAPASEQPTRPATPASGSASSPATSQGAAGGTASAPGSQVPAGEPTPTGPPTAPVTPPAGNGAASPAPAPAPGNDQQKPPAPPPTTPPPANNTQPNGPPNLAFGGMADSGPHPQSDDDLRIKDGIRSCHS